MRSVLGLLSLPALFLGTLLANPLPAQEAAALAPEGTFMALRIASLDRLSQIIKQFTPAPAEAEAEAEDPLAEMFGFLHNLQGVDRAKPVFLFLKGGGEEGPAPWFALPVQDASAFQEGLQIPGKPLMKSGYALLSDALMALEENEGAAPPKLGMPGLAVPAGDVCLRLMPALALRALGSNQLMQFKFMIQMMAPSMLGLSQEQTGAITKAYDQVLALAGKLQALDLAFAGGSETSLTLAIAGAEGTPLATLGDLLKAGPLHPNFGAVEPLGWGWMSMQLAADPPKEIAALQATIQGLLASGQGPAKAFGAGGGLACGLLSSGAFFMAASREAADPAALEPAISSKEGLQKLILEMLPNLPAPGGMGEGPGSGLNGLLGGLMEGASFQASAFTSAGGPVHALNLTIPAEEGMTEQQKATLEKLFPGGVARIWTGMTGKHVTMAMGPEDTARRIFASACGGPASLPGFAQGAVLAGFLKVGALMRSMAALAGEELPPAAKEAMKGMPDGQLRFTLIPKGAAMTARLSIGQADLAALIKAAQALSASEDDEEGEDWRE